MQVTLSLLPGPKNFRQTWSAESGSKVEALSEFRILSSRSKSERKMIKDALSIRLQIAVFYLARELTRSVLLSFRAALKFRFVQPVYF